ncbi:glycosyltransferase family 39 protein [Iningainema tapete]|uniref:Glycosyltransferase family 39 protein n=1 Tax=Iningainema tapete BLCC-T55 TaxID=2748662 RepID=A0A8J6XQK4_9CYAN|nr:glycosyltransferase family 39 protein [Iningainema tapete]MBD2776419.1 glycosyltransferase family 39 protein [Iningainema tapete BLCC-T55]
MIPKTGFKFLAIAVIIIGIFFRFVNLDKKVYWFDETYTSLRTSGYTMSEVVGLCNGNATSIEDLQKYQHPAPGKTLTDTIKSLAVEDPQHPPLYYLMTRFWVQNFGSSVAVIRSLSAVISLLAFPCIYWLCVELFKSSLIGWVAVMLLAVSPFHVLYAQEAREYSLWIVTILLSSATVLRSMRINTKLSWGMYTVTVALGLYTFLFSGFVTIAHGIYIITYEKFRFSKKVIAYLGASLLGALAFLPWVLVVITHSEQFKNTISWTDKKISLFKLIMIWGINLSHFFIDLGYELFHKNNNFVWKIIIGVSILLSLILVGYSIYFLCRNTPKQIWLFVLTLIGVTALPLIIPDVILGGVRSQSPRYLIPAYLGIQLAVAYCLATKMSSISIRTWQLITVALISSGVISCAISSQAETWWLKYSGLYTPQVVNIINQTTRPLIISSCDGIWSLASELSLSYWLEPKVRFQFLKQSNPLQISPGFTDIFLYNSPTNPLSTTLQYKLEKQHYKIEKDIYPTELGLWKALN